MSEALVPEAGPKNTAAQPDDQSAAQTAAAKPSPNADVDRLAYGTWLIAGAFVLLLVVFIVSVMRFKVASDVTAVVGSMTGVVGTIIGAFFGVHVGSQGKQAADDARNQAETARTQAEVARNQAENDRNQAQKLATAALGRLDPKDADEITKMML
jgi:hypothetical protein